MTTNLIWDSAIQQSVILPVETISGRPQSLLVPLHASTASLQFIDAVLREENAQGGYRASFTIEWTGEHLLSIPLNWFEPFGMPGMPVDAMPVLELICRDSGPLRAVLTVGSPAWTVRQPLMPVNDRERLLETFTAPGFWEKSEWQPAEGRGTFEKKWLYAELGAGSGSGEPGFAAFSKVYDIDIRPYQALIVGLSTDERAAFSLEVEVDGKKRLAVDRKPGVGFEELRIPLQGDVLNAVTLQIGPSPHMQSSGEQGKSFTLIYWMMLETAGASPAVANEVYGGPDISPPAAETLAAAASALASPEAGQPHADLLPVGYLFDRDSLGALRSRLRRKGTESSRLMDELRAEAKANLVYRPEDYLGTYMPVDWARQGIERASSPNDETRRLFSTLVYSAFVYAIDGEVRFGLAARRALLTVVRIRHWAAGFVARYPLGLRGYRATFIESHTSQAAALCYDLIYPLLSAEERNEVENALFEKGVLWLDAFLRQNGEGYLLESNQGPVYAVGLLYAAHAAKRRHPEAAAIAERWSEWLLRMLAGYYQADGSTNEGMMYWEYTTHSAIEALLLIGGQGGRTIRSLIPPSMTQTMDYVLHLRSLSHPTLRFIPLGDCRNEDFDNMGPSLLFFYRYLNDTRALALWRQHYAKPHPPGSPFFGVPIGTGQYTTNGLLTLLLLEEEPGETRGLPEHKLFSATERLFWRTGSEYGDKLFFFEGGPQSFEHTHYDKGHFIVEAFGEALVCDPGMIKYSRPFATMLKATRYHNVVTVSGKDQSYSDAARAVVIRALAEKEGYSYLHADVSDSYKELDRYERRFLFVRPDYWIVFDTIESNEPRLEWNLHSKGSFTRSEPDANGDSSASIRQYAAQAALAGLRLAVVADSPLHEVVHVHSDAGIVLSHQLSLQTGRNCRELRLAAVLVPYAGNGDNGACGLTIHAARSEDAAIFTITGDFGTDSVCCRFVDGTMLVRRGDGSTIE